jgi:DNA-binding NtrC family response regulator
MSKRNIIVIDEKQIMAGSFKRYLMYRFSNHVKITSVTDIEHCEREMDSRSQVIVLDYMTDDKYDTNRGAHIKNTIKGFDPDMDVILLTSDCDVRTDIIKSIREMEKQASMHIIKNTKKPLTMIASTLSNAFFYPVKVFIEEHSIGAFLGLFIMLFALIGLMVYLSHFIFGG